MILVFSIFVDRCSIISILSDRILGVEFDNIFIVLNCAKLKFERTIQYYQTADKTETINVIWAPVQ